MEREFSHHVNPEILENFFVRNMASAFSNAGQHGDYHKLSFFYKAVVKTDVTLYAAEEEKLCKL